MALKGDNVQPDFVQDVVSRVELKREGVDEALKAAEEARAQWKAFFSTKSGQVVSSLVDPLIEHLNTHLATPGRDLGLSPEDSALFHAECRGERRVWMRIKFRLSELERELEELKELEREEDKPKKTKKPVGSAGRKKGGESKKKKILEKYT